jgi:hypothetical protein
MGISRLADVRANAFASLRRRRALTSTPHAEEDWRYAKARTPAMTFDDATSARRRQLQRPHSSRRAAASSMHLGAERMINKAPCAGHRLCSAGIF